MEDIQNIIIEKINNYNYDKEVEEYSKELEKNLKQGEIIELFPQIDDNFVGDTKFEIAEKVSKQIIDYKIREKALAKLMSRGIIYPISLCDGYVRETINYKCKSYSYYREPLEFRRLVFNGFMKA